MPRNMIKQPRHKRDYGGSFNLDNPEDGSPIREVFPLGGRLLMITEKCTYGLQLADQIDPERKNDDLPHNVRQKILDLGVNSDILCKTLIQARVMFSKYYLPDIDIDKAMQLAFDALCELASADELAREFKEMEAKALEKAKNAAQRDAGLTIPSIGNVRTLCKTFAQKADHAATALLNIVKLFYPDCKNWTDLRNHVAAAYGENDNFSKIVELQAPFLVLLRNSRDCLDHHNLQGVKTGDFQLMADGTLSPPTIEIDFRKTKHERCPVSWFMDESTKTLALAFEMIVVHLCSKHAKPFAGLPVTVVPLSDEYQKAWRVRFGYHARLPDGRWAPSGGP
jgi:hypothetical protein